MLSISIDNIKKFTEMFFAGNEFDRFLLREFTLNSAFSTTFDGLLNKAFFTEEEQKNLTDTCVSWAEIRPYALKLISGRRLPLSFKAVLITSAKTTQAMVTRSGFEGCPVSSLSLNIVFRESQLFLTTGIAYGGFSADRSLDQAWDRNVRDFLETHDCPFTEL